jgi:hypothetical protein
MSTATNVLSFLRWRIVAVRYAGKIAGSGPGGWLRGSVQPRGHIAGAVQEHGYETGPTLAPEVLAHVQMIYRPRSARVVARPSGHPFVNLVEAEDFSPMNPVFRHAFSREVLDVAHDYFGGRLTLDSIQVLHSWPTEGPPHDSQCWHKDYGDNRSLHCVTYLNDVLKVEDGPFVYVDRADTARIRRSPFIRRISDARFAAELGDGRVRAFHGRAGESVFVDPAACYHYGSRCRHPRLAIFVTFNTDSPFVPATEPIRQQAHSILAAARQVRPDLRESYLRSLLRL